MRRDAADVPEHVEGSAAPLEAGAEVSALKTPRRIRKDEVTAHRIESYSCPTPPEQIPQRRQEIAELLARLFLGIDCSNQDGP
jgi:hypothetical protein